MSLIIKGMKLPQSCSTCRFSYYTVGIRKRCEISGDEVNPLIDCRETNCPLGEIPTPHGRLIDADELYEPMERDLYAGIGCDPTSIAAITISEAPTIIEAEVSE